MDIQARRLLTPQAPFQRRKRSKLLLSLIMTAINSSSRKSCHLWSPIFVSGAGFGASHTLPELIPRGPLKQVLEFSADR